MIFCKKIQPKLKIYLFAYECFDELNRAAYAYFGKCYRTSKTNTHFGILISVDAFDPTDLSHITAFAKQVFALLLHSYKNENHFKS